MSYNIDSTRVLVLDAWMEASDVLRFFDEDEDKIPENCFLHDMRDEAESVVHDPIACGCGRTNPTDSRFCNACGKAMPSPTRGSKRVKLPSISWYGEGTGHTHSFFLEHVAPKVMGTVQAIFTWEGGDSFSGVAIKDGKVAECDVVQSLKLPDGW